jgi:hypothetical protein
MKILKVEMARNKLKRKKTNWNDTMEPKWQMLQMIYHDKMSCHNEMSLMANKMQWNHDC